MKGGVELKYFYIAVCMRLQHSSKLKRNWGQKYFICQFAGWFLGIIKLPISCKKNWAMCLFNLILGKVRENLKTSVLLILTNWREKWSHGSCLEISSNFAIFINSSKRLLVLFVLIKRFLNCLEIQRMHLLK